MKKIIISIITIVFNMLCANAQTISVGDVTIKAGETKTVSINLENTQDNIVSFQMDLKLPEGITINKAGCTLGSRIIDADQELVIGKQPDGSIRLTSTSFALNPISGTNGEIIKLSLTAAKDSKGGTATLKGIIFATSSSQELTPVDATFDIGVSYTLTYMVVGNVYKTSTIVYGTAITPEAEPTKEGYTFSGWSEIPKTMPAKDVVVTGSFTVNSYTLTYKVDGKVYKTSTIAYGTTITPEAAPIKEGYTFSGWSEIPKTMPAKDVVVTGSFSINSYTLTYMVDGVVYKSSSVVYATSITPEAAPSKEGHTFSGWSEIPKTMPAKDVVVTGTFIINSYTLTYKVDGQEYKTSSVVYGTPITPEADPTKEGYTFSGWSEIPKTMPAKDVVVTGSFSINSYTLTYKVDGLVYKSSSVVYGTTITPEAVPTKEGYTFSGWSAIPKTMPAKDVVVTGSFSINSYTLTYKVDGLVYKSSSVVYGTTITPEAVPTKEGYTFSGWSAIPKTMPAKNVTVTGTFIVNRYKLIYKVDGVEYKSYDVEYGKTITPEAAPNKEGYTFSGWSEIPKTMPAKNVTVTGTFIINKYKLIYMVDGVEYKSYEIEYGKTITPEAAPAKEGHTFSGWNGLPTRMPAKNVTVTGTFIINKYKLIYKVDGVEYKSYVIEYGKTITPEAAPSKEGYTFSGWSAIPKTMPAKDVVVTGSFSINSYKLTYKVDGVEYKSYVIEYGKTITPEAAPSKEGYTFSGWSEIPKKMPARDVVVTGSFSINSYTLTYMVDGKVYKKSTVVYGAEITPEATPSKEGYTFSGWSAIPQTMPAKDVVVTGSFSINQYKLTYIIDGKEYKSYKIDYNSVLVLLSVPEKKGMTFSGWGNVPNNMPAHDVTLTGTYSWSQITLNNVIYQVTDTLYNYVSAIDNYRVNGEIKIPSVVEIGGYIFTVKNIESNAFNNCSKLTAITIPETVTNIGNNAFLNCSGLSTVTLKGDAIVSKSYSSNYSLKNIFGTQVQKYIFGDKVTSIGRYAFYGCSGLTSITISNSVTSIGEKAFQYCYINEVNVVVSDFSSFCNNDVVKAINREIGIPVTLINKDGKAIKEYSIPNNVTNIGNYAFYNCRGLNSITIPESVTGIGYYAFYGCTGLTSITIPEGVASIGESAFSGCDNLITVILESNSVVSNTSSYYTLKSVFGNQVKEYILGDKITGVGNYAFYGCSALVALTIPEGLIDIGSNAFSGCNNLKIYAKRGTDGLLSVWKYGIDPYETGTSQLLLRPSISEVSKTQTTIRYRVNNVYSGFNYKIDNDSKPLGNNEYKITGLRPEYWQTIKLTVNSANNSYSTSSDIRTLPINPTITCENQTASSLAVSGSYTKGDAKVVSRSIIINGVEMDGEKGAIHGLDPNKSYTCKYRVVVEDDNGEDYTYYGSQSIRTASLTLSTQQPKVISSGNVIVAAMSNLDDEETKVGFEWRRTDWTDDFTSNTGGAYLFGGKMEGYIRNLNTDKLWKYRPYYESDTGKRYYGDWLGIDPTNTSYFEPTIYTYSSYSVTDNTAEVKGYAMRGSDNVTKQGFMYWKASSRPSPNAREKRALAIPANARMVEANGNVMIAKLDNLDFDTEYHYVAFVTTSENKTYYGEEQTFRTGAGNQEMIDDIDGPTPNPSLVERGRIYDLNGRMLPALQKGLNIIRMSDGTTKKVMVK